MMSSHKFVASVDGTLSAIGIPIGTYFLYVDTWWSRILDCWSAIVVALGLTIMMCIASIQLYSSTNRGTAVEVASQLVSFYVAVCGAFELLVYLAVALFTYPLLWTNIYLWMVLVVGLVIRIPCFFECMFEVKEGVDNPPSEYAAPQSIMVVPSVSFPDVIQTIDIYQGEEDNIKISDTHTFLVEMSCDELKIYFVVANYNWNYRKST